MAAKEIRGVKETSGHTFQAHHQQRVRDTMHLQSQEFKWYKVRTLFTDSRESNRITFTCRTTTLKTHPTSLARSRMPGVMRHPETAHQQKQKGTHGLVSNQTVSLKLSTISFSSPSLLLSFIGSSCRLFQTPFVVYYSLARSFHWRVKSHGMRQLLARPQGSPSTVRAH